jgi:ATP-dependent Clp protease protease subunit
MSLKFLLALAFLAIPTKTELVEPKLIEPVLIEFKKDNFVSLREQINQDSSSRLLSKLNLIETKHNIIYLYINSPGGDVMAGLEIVNYIKSLQSREKQIICIAHNAMSMAFVIFQYCSERYILYSSTLMQHQMSLGVKGKLYDINSRMSYLNSLEIKINQDQATRLNLSLVDFTRLIQNDWWLYSDDIILNKAADKIVSIFCSFDNFDEINTVNTLFGDVTIKYSACPIINYPLQISFPTLNFSEDKKSEFMDTHINFMKKYI